MIRVLFVFIIFLSSCAGQPMREREELANLHLKIGTSYLTQGRYPLALAELLKAEKYAPTNPTVLNNLGLAYYVRGELALALSKLEKAVLTNPKFSEARNNLARILIDQKKYRQAIEQLEIVTKDLLYKAPEKGWVNLGIAYLHQKKYDKARDALRKAIVLKRTYCPAHVIFGRSFFEERNYHEAATSLDRAVSICKDQKYDEPNYYSALSYFRLGQKEKAVAKMKEVIRRFPESEYAEKARSHLKLME